MLTLTTETSAHVTMEEPKLIEMFLTVSRGKQLSKNYDVAAIENSKVPDGIKFKPRVLDQFPTKEMIEKSYGELGLSAKEIKKKTKDAIRPDQVASFAFPDDVDILYSSGKKLNLQPKFFWFVLTDVSGSRFYCATVHFYERVDPLDVACLFLQHKDIKTPGWAVNAKQPVYSRKGTATLPPQNIILRGILLTHT